ncbi:hypothetical protein PYWP30_00335 [Pyrobaculum sp. WP30]|nr:hypothetical protein PYWP30_00335 [Pyrobaculum sp. WP30]
MSDFEFLRAYVEARNVAYAHFRLVRQTAEKISRGVPRAEMAEEERRTADLLWHLGLAVASLEKGLTYRATPQLRRVADGDVSLLAVRLARWTPMRLLLRFLADKGGEAFLDEVEERLGGRMLEVTKRYLPALRLAGLRRPVKKPYNRHVVEAVLLRLGSETGLLKDDRRTMALTELAEELLETESVEVVRTGPNSPVVLAAVAAAAASGGMVYLVSPWIDREVAGALTHLLRDKAVMVSRPPRETRHAKALELLAQRGEVLCYDKLHTKAVAGTSAVVTSANLVKTSLLRNIETGVYYRETPTALRLHLEEVAASGRPCRSP